MELFLPYSVLTLGSIIIVALLRVKMIDKSDSYRNVMYNFQVLMLWKFDKEITGNWEFMCNNFALHS